MTIQIAEVGDLVRRDYGYIEAERSTCAVMIQRHFPGRPTSTEMLADFRAWLALWDDPATYPAPITIYGPLHLETEVAPATVEATVSDLPETTWFEPTPDAAATQALPVTASLSVVPDGPVEGGLLAVLDDLREQEQRKPRREPKARRA